MRVLIIKTSSMGDIIHTLPAVTDAALLFPHIVFDWVVEENFAEIPGWHPRVAEIIPVAVRRWRKALFSRKTRQEWRLFRQVLRKNHYDLILDAQGLTKSAWLALNARGKRVGLNSRSSRDPLSALFYQRTYSVDPAQHAVARVRHLFSQALGYPNPVTAPDYGIPPSYFSNQKKPDPYLVFLHGTTWATKHWPEHYWIELAKKVADHGFKIKLLWGNPVEKERAHRIALHCPTAEILPRLSLKEIASVLSDAKAIVAVDTGFGHLAAALNVPTISLYGPTDPILTGAYGPSQTHLAVQFPCAPCLGRECTFNQSALYPVNPPCFSTLTPERVWRTLRGFL